MERYVGPLVWLVLGWQPFFEVRQKTAEERKQQAAWPPEPDLEI